MNTGTRLAAFAVVLGGALGAGALIGNVVGPISAGEPHGDDTAMDDRVDDDAAMDRATDSPTATAPGGTATVAGYEVTLRGSPAAGTDGELRLTVRRDGRPVTDLAPYPDGFGHLVAIGEDDLSAVPVRPLDRAPAAGAGAGGHGGPDVAFSLHVPSPGDYRLFFDFSHDGTVHTATFTVHVPAGGEAHDAGGHGA